jgi:glycosyltransferase involved in cell wall biosynthesis
VIQKYILIGAKPPAGEVPNPGGQLTASIGLVEIIGSLGFEIDVIDTTQSSFPVPKLKVRLFKGLFRTKQLYSHLKSNNITGVIIFSSFGFSFYERVLQSLLCRVFRVPDILFVRSGHFITATNTSVYYRFLVKLLLKIPRRLGVQGGAWVDFYKSLGVNENKIVIVRNWLRADFPALSQPKKYKSFEKIRFIFVGWLVKEKGIYQLLEAVKMLKNDCQFELHLVGGGTLESYCKEFKGSNNLGDTLFIHGWKDKNRVIELLNDSDVFVLPSDAEGFPNALLEAVALGLPAICTDVGGVSDTLIDGKNGFLLRGNKSNLIYAAMKKYIDSPDIINFHSQESLRLYKLNHDINNNCQLLLKQFSNEYL